MSQFWIENIYEHKRINDARYFSNFRNELNQLNSIDSANQEFENAKNKNPLDCDFINEDFDKQGKGNKANEANESNNIPNMNPLYINNNAVEHNHISSMNTTNENKISDFTPKIPILSTICNNLLKKKKIFDIEKVNKKLGRLKKNSKLRGKHNKLAEDNIIRKIKRRFTENLRLYINEEYKNYRTKIKKTTNRKNWLRKINPKLSLTIKKTDNIKWFNLKLYELFSDELSMKYTSHNIDSNKKKIKNFISLNESNRLKDILNTTVDELYSRYISNQSIDEFKTLSDDLRDLETLMKKSEQINIKEYLKKYEKIAINLKDIIMNKAERNRKKKL